MRETSVVAVKSWPVVNLMRGIKLGYRGKELYFPKVYMGASGMDDFDIANASIDVKEADEDQRQIVSTRKALTLCSRVFLNEGYAATKENIEMQESYAKRERARKKLERKISKAEEEFTIQKLTKELEEIPSLEQPPAVFPSEEEVLSFGIVNMSGEGTLPIDNIRLVTAFSELNYFGQEEVEDFLFFPGN